MKVRTTMQPDVELDVEPSEYIDLSRQGLLVDTGPPRRLPEGVSLPADVTDTTKAS
jgi:hypothetical protein